MDLKASFPYRALRYGLRLPGRIYSTYITEPIIKRWIKQSELMVYVHDPKRGLLRPVLEGERLRWTLKENLSVDATHWLDVIEPLLTKQDIVFDVGTNIGTIANWLANRTQHVHGFEPHPANIEMTRDQIEIRKAKNITLSQLALGSEPGILQLHVKSFHGHHSLGDTAASPTVEKIDVEVDTVDRYCLTHGIERIDFLKIDVEGFEDAVLQGSTSMLKNHSIGFVLFELRHSILASVDKHSKDIFTPLTENGYSVFTLDGRTLTADELENPSDGDYLAAVNPEEFVPHLGTSTALLC
ncbi:MAG: FkbM family methyltransferase [Candidatus Poseidonia sp.]|nr:FkbM family methyltransferase [Poseidonia sp.]MBL6892309.1 FkbM family methyltransferase [Poseidonia sp.]